MQNSPADVIRWLLVAIGQGSDPNFNPLVAWPAYVGVEPSAPDNCLTVYDTTGQDDGRSMIDGFLFTHYGFQVRVRSADQPTGWLKANTIRNAFATQVYANTITIGGASYIVHCITHIGQVLSIGKDSPNTKRSVFTLNALASLRQTSP